MNDLKLQLRRLSHMVLIKQTIFYICDIQKDGKGKNLLNIFPRNFFLIMNFAHMLHMQILH